MGVSVIAHPMNPFCATSHMNVRIFLELSKNNLIENWWIGGGNLTPFFPTKDESSTWHLKAKMCLDNFDLKYHKILLKIAMIIFTASQEGKKRYWRYIF